MGVAAITATFVPRILGPSIYGNYNFLLNTSQTIRNLLEPSVQQAFFTFSSQDRQSGPLTKLYGLFLLAQFGLTLGLIALSALLGFVYWLFPGQALDQILWVIALDWVLFVALNLRQLGDSKGLTVRPQTIGALTSMITLFGILMLVALGRLDIYSYIWLNLFSASVSCVALGRLLLVQHHDECWRGDLSGRVHEYVRRWWRYALPVIPLEYVLPLLGYISIYLIQVWYGSVEQGFFSLAYRWSALVLVFTSSAMAIVWREIARALADNEHDRAGYVYIRFNRMLFALTLMLCVWLSLSGTTLVLAFAGDAYQAAIPVFMVMAFYPLQQTYGQLNTIALKAAERTKDFRNLTILIAIPDVLLSYFLLAPTNAAVPGLGLGAMGIALRFVVYGLLSAQLYEWVNSRFFGFQYAKLLLAKLATVVIIGASGVGTILILGEVLRSRWALSALYVFAITSALYFALIGIVVLVQPRLAGFRRAELSENMLAVYWKIRQTLE